MTRSLIRGALNQLWMTGALLVILFALYVALGRQFMPALSQYRTQIEANITGQLGMPVRIGELEGSWTGFEPAVIIQNLRILPDFMESMQPLIEIDRVALHFDTLQSIVERQFVFRDVMLDGVRFELVQTGKAWHLRGLTPGEGVADLELLVNWVLAQQRGSISGSEVGIHPEEGLPYKVSNILLSIANAGQLHRFEGSLQVTSEKRNASFQVAAEARGSPFDPENFFADIYLSLTEGRIEDGFSVQGLDILQIGSMRASGEAWAYWRDGMLDFMVGTLSIPDSTWVAGGGRLKIPIENAGASFVWRGESAESWSLELDDIEFSWGEHRSHVGKLRLARDPDDRQFDFVADRLAVGPFVRFLRGTGALPERLSGILADLSPRGDLTNIQVDYRLDPEVRPRFRLRANLVDVAVESWGNAPALSGIQGYVESDERSGHVDLDTTVAELAFPRMFRDSWKLDIARGRVGWRLGEGEVRVRSSILDVSMPQATLRAQFGLSLPLTEEAAPGMSLRIGVLNADATVTGSFLPAHVMGEGAVEWLDNAPKSAREARGAYIYHGSLKAGDRSEFSSILNFDVLGAEVQFAPDWPVAKDVDAWIVGRADEILVDVSRGSLLDAQLDALSVRLPLSGRHAGKRLYVDGSAKTTLAGGIRLLRNTPLRAHTPEAMDTWKAGGQVSAKFRLRVPLGPGTPGVDLTARIRNGSLTIPQADADLEFKKVAGEILYTDAKGLAIDDMRARFLGDEAKIRLKTVENERTGGEIRVYLDSRATPEVLREFTGIQLFSFMRGQFPYQARLRIFGRDRDAELIVDSHLGGLEIDMPYPLLKQASVRIPLRYRIRLGEKEDRIRFELGAILRGRLVQENGVIQRGVLRFGGDAIRELPATGLRIEGQVSFLDFNDWSEFIPELDRVMSGAAAGGSMSGLVHSVNLEFERLLLFEREVLESRAIMQRRPESWNVDLRNEVIHAEAKFPHDEAQPYDIHVHYLRLHEVKMEGAGSGDPLGDVNPALLPPMNVRMDEIRYGDLDLGRWQFATESVENGVRFRDVSGHFRNTDYGSGSLEWLRDGDAHHTHLQLIATAGDVARVLEAWNFTPTLDSREAWASANLKWPASPAGLHLPEISGQVAAKIDKGRFIEVDSRASALRVFGILNVDTISRRLRLDFSDLFKKGLTYDQIKGRFSLKNGILTSMGTLDIEGPSTKFYLSGRIDLLRETLDQELVVTLPVTASLPFAALLAGAPALAGAIYLTEKLLGDKLERLASARYRVRGSWNDPEVKLIKMFSDKD